MSNDQGIRRKHKQRTVPHKKHVAFPGMQVPKDMMIVAQSIKPIQPKIFKPDKADAKPISYKDEEWIAYDAAAKKLAGLGGSAAQALRVKNEHEFYQAYRKLVKKKMAYRIKRKYRP